MTGAGAGEFVVAGEVPPPDDVTFDYWAATCEHRLTVQRCDACGHRQHPPRALCMSCGTTEHLGQADAGGVGTVDAFTVVHRAASPDLPVPYTIARVRLAEGPLVLTRLVGDRAWVAGDRVRVDWLDLPDGRALPYFRPEGTDNAEGRADGLRAR
jgi:uncharacterized OB-fold protein